MIIIFILPLFVNWETWWNIKDHNRQVIMTKAVVTDYNYDAVKHDDKLCVVGRVVYGNFCEADKIKCKPYAEIAKYLAIIHPVNRVDYIYYIPGEKQCTNMKSGAEDAYNNYIFCWRIIYWLTVTIIMTSLIEYCFRKK